MICEKPTLLQATINKVDYRIQKMIAEEQINDEETDWLSVDR